MSVRQHNEASPSASTFDTKSSSSGVRSWSASEGFLVNSTRESTKLSEKHSTQVAAAKVRLALAVIDCNIGYKT